MAGFKELGVLKNVFLMFLKEDDQFDFEMEGDDNDFSKLLTFVCRPSFVCSVFFFVYLWSSDTILKITRRANNFQPDFITHFVSTDSLTPPPPPRHTLYRIVHP